jgi:hypothetical protein
MLSSGTLNVSNFEDVKKKDFDLIFFHTEEYPFKIVQTACSSDWCHIALILLLTDHEISELKRTTLGIPSVPLGKPSDDAKRVYILESTTDLYPCVVTGKKTNGVKMCLLEERLSTGICGYKSVVKQQITKKNAAKRALVHDIVPSILGIPYERNLCNLVKAWGHWLGCCYLSTYDESSMFCTELITHVFTRLGLLRAEHRRRNKGDDDDKSMIPYDFLETGGKFRKTTNYTDEDLVLEDYVFLETNFLKENSWLSYGKLTLIKIG